MAGESARAVAQKRRDKAERLNRVADAYERGADGEVATAHALAALPVSGWFVLHDVRWPGKRFANIDHVAIGPGGVFVIDSKAWSGVVEVRDGVLRQNGYKRDSAVAGAADAAKAVGEQVPGVDAGAVKPVLCFVGDHQLEGRTGDVLLCTTSNLVSALLSRPEVLDERAVRLTLLALQEALKAATAVPQPRRRRSSTRATRPSKSQPRLGRSVLRLLGFLVMVGFLLVGLREIPRLGSPLAHLEERALGTPVTLAGGTHRPPLRVIADRAGTAHSVGPLTYLGTGNRLFAVRVRIKNVGRRLWVSQPGTAFQVIDADDIPHESENAVRIREGRALPETIRLAPGHVVRGYVVFQDDKRVPITGFTLSVGPGEPGDAAWSIDRQ